MKLARRIFNPSFGRLLLGTERFIGRLGTFTAVILLPALIGTRIIEIVLRGILNKPGSLFNAMEGELFIMFIFLAIAAAYVDHAHVRVDLFRSRFSPRVKAMVEIAGTVLFVLPFCLIVLWFAIPIVFDTYGHGEKAAIALGAPARWVIIATVPLGIGLFLIAALSRSIRYVGFLLTYDPHQPRRRSRDH